MYDFSETVRQLTCPMCETKFYCCTIFADEGGELYLMSYDKKEDGMVKEHDWWWCASCPKCEYSIKVMKYEKLK